MHLSNLSWGWAIQEVWEEKTGFFCGKKKKETVEYRAARQQSSTDNTESFPRGKENIYTIRHCLLGVTNPVPSSKTNVPILALEVLQIQCQEKLVTSHEGYRRDTRQGLCHGWQQADQNHKCLQVCHLWFNHHSDLKAQIFWQKRVWYAESTLKIKKINKVCL